MELISTHWCRLWIYYKLLYSMFSKDTKPFHFIKRNIIWKLTSKVKYIDQINGGLIMFLGNLKVRFSLRLVGSIVKIWKEWRQKETQTYFSVQRFMTYILFRCHRSIDNPMIFMFLFCREKAHNNKKSSLENSKPCRKSQITTRSVEPWDRFVIY